MTRSRQYPAILLTFSYLLGASFADGVRNYSGYQVLRVNATTTGAFELIKDIFHSESYEFWREPSKQRPIDMLVSPGQLEGLKSLLRTAGAPHSVIVEDLQRKMDYEVRDNSLRQSRSMSWTAYQSLSKIHAWEDTLEQEHPGLVSILTIGESFEGRPLRVIKISNAKRNNSKPAIWIDGGTHAREWISPATVSYIANELVETAATGNDTRLVDAFDWYIDPNVNPDGYEYSWRTKDRMWRKTRSDHHGTSLKGHKGGSKARRSIWDWLFGSCKGTDPNRNFDYKWGGKGTSGFKCSGVYRGPHAASEPEVRAVQDFVYDRRENIKLFLTFHSYSQMILLPWGFDDKRVDDYDEMMAVAKKAAAVLESVHGTKYQVGPLRELLYPAAGGAEDYPKGVAGIKFSYCFELRDTGCHGFLLPEDQILPSGEETFAAVKSMAEDVIAHYKLNSTHSN